jgi:hypothetical protein
VKSAKKKAPRPRKLRNLPGSPALTQAEPQNERDLKFCERWLVHHDPMRAYTEAGFSTSNHSAPKLARRKVERFRRYLQGRLPKIEKLVAKQISYERTDILAGIARIANANALDYVEPYEVIDEATGLLVTKYRMKALTQLTRDQAAAVDTVTYCALTGAITYTLPSAKTRLSAFTTLGEQAAGFSRKDETHNHLHLHDVPLEKLRHIKGLLIDMVGPNAARQVFGMEYDGAPESAE